MRCKAFVLPVFPLELGLAWGDRRLGGMGSARDPEPLWAPGDVSRNHRHVLCSTMPRFAT